MKGFSYVLEDEKLLEYQKLSDEDKLQWLEEIQLFNLIALGEREKELHEQFRKGLI